jgi:O-antigen ligase
MAAHGTSERALGAAAAAALLACWPVSDVTFDGYHLPKELLLALCAAVAAPLALGGRDAVSRVAWAFAVATGVGAAFAFNGWLAARAAALTVIGVVLFEAVRALDDDGRERVLEVLAWSALALAAVAFIESQGLLPGLSRSGRAPGATVGQRNAVAHALVLAAPAVLHVARRRWLVAAGAVLLPAVIILTRCRGAWLGLVAALAVWLWRTRSFRLALFSLAGVAAAALLPTQLAWSAAHPLQSTLARLVDGSQGSGLGRLEQWHASLALVPAHPVLGAGPGNWMVAYPLVSPPGDPTFRADTVFSTGRLLTSDWVELLVERGMLGLLAAAALLVEVLRAMRGSKAVQAPAAEATLAGLLVIGQFDSVLQVPAGLAVAALAIGAGLPRTPAPTGRLPVLALRGALGAAALYSATLLLAFGERRHGDFASLERAVRWAPGDVVARQTLAEAYALEGRCDDAGPHLAALREQLPFQPAVKALAESCRR